MRKGLLYARGLAALGVLLAVVVLAGGAAATIGGGTAYSPGTAQVDGIVNGPWNTSQGDGTDAAFPTANLFPYTPTSTSTPPNLALYAGAGASPSAPYPSGVAGAPGPLAGYCTPGFPSNGTSTVQSEPTGIDLPFAPYYFPDVVRNSDGSLTGYFDYRPKDADEAIVAARSTDNGRTWTAEGKALDQNGSYCPTADTNDDGQGHPFVMAVAGNTSLYTLQRPAGDNTGIGLLVHQIDPSNANPLHGLPATESVGIDPNTFATSAVSVPTSGGVAIPVSTLGSAGSPENIVAGPYEDLNAASPATSIVTCTGTAALQLTGCTVAGGSALSVGSGDDLVQVIATANPGTGKTFTVPQGPPAPTDGSGGLATLNISNGNPVVSPLTTYILNLNAPNRVYIDGATVYCAQSNAAPTTKIENCTTTNAGGLTVHQGDPITADPIVPPTATMTTGLLAPDGIVGTVPSYPGAPAGSTVVLYTEKILSYFIEGTTNSKITYPLSNATIAYGPSVTGSEQPLPAGGSFSIYLGATNSASAVAIEQITCTGWSTGSHTGCSGGTSGFSSASGNWIGGPNAATAPISVLNQIGEGNTGGSKGPEKLSGNNEDYSVLRAAYTTDGIHFTDLGAISGSTSGLGSTTGNYDDVSNPFQTVSPSATAPTSPAVGSTDTIELRYIGSRGTIITNPDGSLGMFLSGAWATDGDSDAFNQIFYTTSTDGQHWTTPVVVLATDYTFAASRAQQGTLNPLGISAYYSGRAYGPSVVQNPDGSLTMVFSGYRAPKPVATDGDVLGTNPSATYTVGPNDPALYRNILTMTLSSSTSPRVGTNVAVTPSSNLVTYGDSVGYTATVTVPSPGTGTPTGTVAFTDSGSPITGCSAVPLSVTTPDVATCTTTPSAGPHAIVATYSGDANYAGSAGNLSQTVGKAPLTAAADAKSRPYNTANPALTATVSGFVLGQTLGTSGVTGSAACSTTAALLSAPGGYPITCTLGTLASSNYSFSTVSPSTLTVTFNSVVSDSESKVQVSSGEAVEIAPGAVISGTLNVRQGGYVDVEGGSMTTLNSDGAVTVVICGGTFSGDVSVKNGTGTVTIGGPTCGNATFGGALSVQNNSGAVVVGNETVHTTLTVSGNTGGVSVTANHVTSDTSVTQNTGGATVTGNTIGGSLTVRTNFGTVVDRPNTVSGTSTLQ